MKVLRRRGYTVLELLFTVAATCVVAGVVFPLFDRARENSRSSSCQSNLKQVGLALIIYAQDYDQRFPRAALATPVSKTGLLQKPFGWVDAIQPYLKSNQLFQCPSESTKTNLHNPTARGYTDYYLNQQVSGVAQKYVMRANDTVLCGDGNDGHDQTDARYAMNALRPEWYGAGSPVRRHQGRGNYLFCDGSVRSYAIGDGRINFNFR